MTAGRGSRGPPAADPSFSVVVACATTEEGVALHVGVEGFLELLGEIPGGQAAEELLAFGAEAGIASPPATAAFLQ